MYFSYSLIILPINKAVKIVPMPIPYNGARLIRHKANVTITNEILKVFLTVENGKFKESDIVLTHNRYQLKYRLICLFLIHYVTSRKSFIYIF